VTDLHDQDDQGVVLDGTQDPVVTGPVAPQPITAKRLPGAVWTLGLGTTSGASTATVMTSARYRSIQVLISASGR
jgi:hypothetical protein